MAGITITPNPMKTLCERQMRALSPLYRLLATEQDRHEALRKRYTLSGAELFALVEVCESALLLSSAYTQRARRADKVAIRKALFETLGDMSRSIDAAEKEKRKKAVDYARASVGLEGFTLTPEDEEAARRFVDGEIDLQEFVSGTRKQAEK